MTSAHQEANGDDDEQSNTIGALREWLKAVRTDPTRRRRTTMLAALVGLVFASIHPIGLLIGGALTALPQQRLATGVIAGLGFGLIALAAFGSLLAAQGAVGTALATGEILGVTVATGLVLPLLGSLFRGIV